MRNTGLSAVIGSWKISEISAPRTDCISRSPSVRRSRPLKRTRPPAIRPGGCTSRMIDKAVTDLPLPDSPTSPSVSPAPISKLTSSTAATGPRVVSKTVVRRSTDRRGSRFTVHGSRFGVLGSNGRCFFELAEHGAQSIRDLADRRLCFDGGDDRRHEIAAVARGLRHGVDGAPPPAGVAARANRMHALVLL